MAGAGEKAAPAVAVAGAWIWMARLAAGPAVTLNEALAPLVKPEALALSCLPLPAASISRSLNAAVPLPAAVPISAEVVPSNGPVPPVRPRFTNRSEERRGGKE